jgi:GGDEF domain-containing protein
LIHWAIPGGLLAITLGLVTLLHWLRPRRKPVDPRGWRFSEARKPTHLSVTGSIGVADSAGADAEPEEVLKKAGRAHYCAKKAGRNRVAK